MELKSDFRNTEITSVFHLLRELTPREWSVLLLVIDDFTNKEIKILNNCQYYMNYFLAHLMLIIPLMSYSQGKQSGKFTYERQVTSGGHVVRKQIEDLLYNGSESIHIIYGTPKQLHSDTLKMDSDRGERMMVVAKKEEENLVYYKNYKTRQLLSTELLMNGKRCYVQDTIPTLNWSLVAEKKQIGPYMCQKATTTFRCADYEAWFTTEIPLPIGPWKIGGLPGLIVELTNKRVNNTFRLLSAQYPIDDAEAPIAAPVPPKGGLFLSFNEFSKLAIKEQNKSITFMQGNSDTNMKTENVAIITPECYSVK
ncbi:MAG: GLPGLI family protein [Siphonobacter sp.]